MKYQSINLSSYLFLQSLVFGFVEEIVACFLPYTLGHCEWSTRKQGNLHQHLYIVIEQRVLIIFHLEGAKTVIDKD